MSVPRRTADALANALEDALEDLANWAECSTEGMTAKEKRRYRGWQRTLHNYRKRQA
jgi:hypothetical protein